jgi:hypothetical protein
MLAAFIVPTAVCSCAGASVRPTASCFIALPRPPG